ncbi:nucleotidyltransferase family protein [Kitasatospora purpeofusca]|uniref:nucleotidyltransferase family protein n=1 Tax=Kitasatospora purpeofusca TaxID=67352 RepID=UPI00225A54EF|nr:nucleotidyltransferase family protein [Kitasatospora purpeofusca]MCX4686670.1 nucleotidyltransferase family protein [Kitasatospora purpeofusca]
METPAQAIILAGGQATRMRPYTDDAPKAMVPVADVPIIGYQLVWLARQGITDVVVSGGYRHEMIKHYAGDGARFGVRLTYAIESEPLGRGGALKFATAFLRDPADPAPVAVLNGDIVTGFSLVEMAERHRMRQAAVTIALSQYRSNWGVADLDERTDRIFGFTQSPVLPYWINAGVYLIDTRTFPLFPDKGDHEDSTFPELAKDGRLFAHRIDGYWRGIDTVKDVIVAGEEAVRHGFALGEEFRITS